MKRSRGRRVISVAAVVSAAVAVTKRFLIKLVAELAFQVLNAFLERVGDEIHVVFAFKYFAQP